MQQSTASQEPIPLSEQEILEIFGRFNNEFASRVQWFTVCLVDIPGSGIYKRGKLMGMSLQADCTALIHQIRIINSDPNHILCKKVQLVKNPYL